MNYGWQIILFFSLSGRKLKFQLTVATVNVILHQEIHVSFLFETAGTAGAESVLFLRPKVLKRLTLNSFANIT